MELYWFEYQHWNNCYRKNWFWRIKEIFKQEDISIMLVPFFLIFQFGVGNPNWQFCGSVSTLPVLAVFIITWWFHRDIGLFSLFFLPVLWPKKFEEPIIYLCWMWGTGEHNPQQDENLIREYCDERQYC